MDLSFNSHPPLRDSPPPAAAPAANGTHAPWDDSLYDHRRVLLMSAVQHAMLTVPSAVPNHASVGANIDRILATARAAPHPPLIVHVRNIGDPGDADEKGTPGWELVHTPLPHEPVLDKTKNNAFAGTRLHEWICPEAEIVVVGMQSDFCISATCKAALDRGNTVILIRGAHATSDRLEVNTPITPAAQIEKQVEQEMEDLGVVLLDMSDLDDLFTDR
ncbi:hypothetical protein EIP86_000703 [Pleurotus ostreatoroseus]|nr:hypothetical protein EIP86_000703 [Pleurotus ostreatoroseus]